jgi:hypothetical protein
MLRHSFGTMAAPVLGCRGAVGFVPASALVTAAMTLATAGLRTLTAAMTVAFASPSAGTAALLIAVPAAMTAALAAAMTATLAAAGPTLGRSKAGGTNHEYRRTGEENQLAHRKSPRVWVLTSADTQSFRPAQRARPCGSSSQEGAAGHLVARQGQD